MTETRLPYRTGSYVVTDAMLSTPRQVFLLRDIDHVECRRPLLLAMAPAAAFVGMITLRFSDLLTGAEIAGVLVAAGFATALASWIGVLRLRSLSIRDEAIWGAHHRLKNVRFAIEIVMQRRLAAAPHPLRPGGEMELPGPPG